MLNKSLALSVYQPLPEFLDVDVLINEQDSCNVLFFIYFYLFHFSKEQIHHKIN